MSVKPQIKAVTVNTIQKLKNEGTPITSLTAYDYSTAKTMDEAGIDFILVGDSLAMVALGYETTHSVTVEDMLHHAKAVARGAKRALVVVDMPFMSYQVSESEAVHNAGKFIKEANAGAVKLEGATELTISIVKRCVEAGIPVLGHLGFTPQFLHTIGGYNVQGKNVETTKRILEQAKALEIAGAFAVVLEMVPEESAKYITENLTIPTIGIGAGRYCSGQILVIDDLLGKYSNFTPKFARKYVDLALITKDAFEKYIEDIAAGTFPAEKEIFNLTAEEKKRLNG